MELRQLRGFIAVAQAKSFTKAAENLFITQPALSLQVKGLEEELNEKLFERQGKQLQLTQAGEVLFERTQEILGLVEQMGQELQALQDLRGGRVVIGSNDSYCLYLLPNLVQFFRKRFPAIDLQFINRHSADVVKLVATGEVDFGLVTLPVLKADIAVEHLCWREDVAICHPIHPIAEVDHLSLENLVRFPMLVLGEGSTSRALLNQHWAQASVVPRSTMQLGSIEVIKRFVEINLGVAIVPGFTIEAELKAKRLQAIRLPWLSAPAVGIVQRQKGHLSPAGRMFIKLLKNRVPDVLLCPPSVS